MSEPQSLWLRVQSDEFAISTSSRFRRQVRLYPADRLIRIEPLVLHNGLFVGAARACQLRLEKALQPWPQFAIRNSRNHIKLMGFGCEVFYNGCELGLGTQTLSVNDTIICDPYLLRVVERPADFLQDLMEKVVSEGGDDEDAGGSGDFELADA